MIHVKLRCETFAALDIGTSKICCLIAEIDQTGTIRIKGIGHNMSKGITNGRLTNFQDAEIAIQAAVHNAEKMAKVTVEKVFVNLLADHSQSSTYPLDMPITPHQINDADIHHLNQQKDKLLKETDLHIVNSSILNFRVDQQSTLEDPRGLFGQFLGLDLHVVTCKDTITENLKNLLSQCQLKIQDIVPPALACQMSTLTKEEKDTGGVLIDLGAGTTHISLFKNHQTLFTQTFPMGGNQITDDISHCLGVTFSKAERMKTLRGSAMNHSSQMGSFNEQNDDDFSNTIQLNQIIHARIEEMFEIIHDTLNQQPHSEKVGHRIILTGGGSQLNRIVDVAESIFNCPVSLARPQPISGLAEAISGPPFCAVTGLILYAAQSLNNPIDHMIKASRSTSTRFGRLGRWFQEKF